MGRLIRENEMRYYGVKIKRDKQILGNNSAFISSVAGILWQEIYLRKLKEV